MKFSFLVLTVILAVVAAIFFYQRYSQIERSVRAAESAAENPEAFYSTPPPEAAP